MEEIKTGMQQSSIESQTTGALVGGPTLDHLDDDISSAIGNAARAFSARARVLLTHGKYGEAEADFSRAIEISKTLNDVFHRGVCRFFLKHSAGALADFDHVLFEEPLHMALLYKNRLLTQLGEEKDILGPAFAGHHAQKIRENEVDLDDEEIDTWQLDRVHEGALQVGEESLLWAKVLIRHGVYPEAAKMLMVCKKYGVQPATVAYFRAINYYKLGEYRKALLESEKAIALGANKPFIYIIRASVWSVLGEPKKAMEEVSNAILQQPMFEAFKLKANLFLEKGEYKNAIHFYGKALKVKLDADVHNWAGVAQYQLGQFQKAADHFSKAFQLRDRFGLALLRLGLAFLKLGEREKAFKVFSILVDQAKPAEHVTFFLSRLYRSKMVVENQNEQPDLVEQIVGDTDEGLRTLSEIDFNRDYFYSNIDPVQLNHQMVLKMYLYRGRGYYLRQDYDWAIRDYTHILSECEDVTAYRFRSDVFFKKKLYTRAIADLDKAIEIEPSITSYLKRGLAFFANRAFGKADLDFTYVIKNDPTNIMALRKRAFCRMKTDAYYDASLDLSTLIKRQPFASDYFDRGECHRYLNQFALAIADYLQAANLGYDRDSLPCRLGLGYAYWHAGQKAKAQKELEQAAAILCEAVNIDPTVYLLDQYMDVLADSQQPQKVKFEAEKTQIMLDQLLAQPEPDTQLYFLRAKVLTRLEKDPQALTDIETYLTRKRSFAALALKGDILARIGNMTQACDTYEQALVIRSDASTLNKRGLLYYQNKRYYEAVGDFKAAYHLNTNDFPAVYNLARACQQQGNHLEAYQFLSMLMTKNCQEDRCLYFLVSFQRAKLGLELRESERIPVDRIERDIATAMQVLPELKSSNRRHLQLVDQIQDGYSGEIHLLRGKIRYLQLDFSGAYRDFCLASGTQTTAENLLWRGKAVLQMRKPGKAIIDFSAALSLDPCLELYFKRGQAHVLLQDLNQAFADFSHVIAGEPEHAGGRRAIAAVEKQRRNYRLAISHFSLAIQFDATPEDYLERADCYQAINEYALAYEDYSTLLADFPAQEQVMLLSSRAKCYLGLNEPLKAQQDLLNALDMINKRIATESKLSDYLQKAEINTLLKRYAEAYLDYTHALSQKPTAQLYYQRGIIHGFLGKIPQQIEDFSRSIVFSPQLAAYIARGLANMELKHYAEAYDDYSAAIAMHDSDALDENSDELGDILAAYVHRSKSLALMNRDDEAFDDLSKVFKRVSGCKVQRLPEKTAYYAGLACFKLGHWKNAVVFLDQSVVGNPHHAESYFYRADALFRLEKFEEALENYYQAEKLRPDWSIVPLKLSETWLHLGHLDQALKSVSRSIELGETTAALHIRARIFGQQENFHDALLDYTELLKHVQTAPVYLERSRIYFGSKDYDRALADCQLSISMDPQAEAYVNLADMWSVMLRWNEAIEAFTKAIALKPDYYSYFQRAKAWVGLSDYTKAIDDLGQAIEYEATDLAYCLRGSCWKFLGVREKEEENYTYALAINKRAETFYTRAKARFALEKWAAAISDATKAIALGIGGTKEVEALIIRAHSYFNQQRFSESLEDYGRIIGLEKNARAYSDRACCWLTQRKYQKAIADADAAIACDPHFQDAYWYRAEAHFEQMAYRQAIRDYGHVLTTDPQHIFARNNRGVSYLKCQEYQLAIDDFSQSLRLDDGYFLAFYNRALSYKGLKEIDNAIADLTSLLNKKPDFIKGYKERGDLWHQIGETEKAAKDFKAAINLDENDMSAVFACGKTLFKAGDFGQAKSCFEKMIRQTHEAEAQVWRGKCANKLGEYQLAINDYTVALQKEPTGATYCLRGEAWGNLKEYRKSIHDYTTSIRLSPSFDAYRERGDMRKKLGEYNLALEDYQHFLQHQSTDLHCLNAVCEILTSQGKFHQVLDAAATSIRIKPSVKAYVAKGYALVNLGKNNEAISWVNEALKLDATNSGAILTRGLALYNMKMYERAVSDLGEVISRNKQSKVALLCRAQALFRLHHYSAAISDLGCLLTMDPQDQQSIILRGDSYVKEGNYEAAIKDFTAIICQREDASVLIRRAQALYLLGVLPKAISDFDRCLKLNATVEGYVGRGLCYYQMDDFTKAMDDFISAEVIDAKDPAPYFYKGCTYFHAGNYQSAIDEFSNALDHRTDSMSILYRGFAFYKQGNTSKALADIDQAVAVGASVVAIFSRANLYFTSKRYEKAIIDYTRIINDDKATWQTYLNRGCAFGAMDDHLKAINDFNKSFELGGDRAELFINLGLTWNGMRDYRKAIDELNRAERIASENNAIYMIRGSIYGEMKAFDNAIKDFSRFIDKNPNNPLGYLRRGSAFAAINEVKKASQDMTSAMELGGEEGITSIYGGDTLWSSWWMPVMDDDVNIDILSYQHELVKINDKWLQVAEVKNELIFDTLGGEKMTFRPGQDDTGSLQLGLPELPREISMDDYRREVDSISSMIKKEPSAPGFFNRAQAYEKISEYLSAIKDYSQAIEIDSTFTMAYFERAKVWESLGELANAINDYSRVIEQDESNVAAYFARGDAWSRLEKTNKSIPDYTKAIGLVETLQKNREYKFEDVTGQLTTAARDKYLKHVHSLNKIIQREPDNAGLYNQRGKTFYRMGMYDLAVNDFKTAKQVNPQYISVLSQVLKGKGTAL